MDHFINLKEDRLIVHEIRKRLDKMALEDPIMAVSLTTLAPEAHDVFCQRVAAAMTHCIEMSLAKAGPGSLFEMVQRLLATGDDKTFIEESRTAAKNLAFAQDTVNIPGGLLIVFAGETGVPGKRYIAFLKAEPQSGFRCDWQDGSSALEFIKELFLTPNAKVYKIGMFIQNDPDAAQKDNGEGFKFFLYDANAAPKEIGKAAVYFYEAFLGLMHISTNALTTKKFILATKEFINKMDVPEEQKVDLRTALTVYMRMDQAATASVNEFGKKYFGDAAVCDSFALFAEKKKLPAHAFTKDLSESHSLLKRRKVQFGGDIELRAPADKFKDKIELQTLPQKDGSVWSQVTIRDRIIGEK